jgi:hypothetical protein
VDGPFLRSQPGDVLEIVTDAGLRLCRINSLSATAGFTVEVTTGMGVPCFEPHTVTLAGGLRIVGVASPPAIRTLSSWSTTPICCSRKALAKHRRGDLRSPDFPQQTNVEFVRVLSPDQIEIRIFERGVGPTASSGTGSSAAATAATAFMSCLSPLTVLAPGGAQTVTWEGPGANCGSPASIAHRPRRGFLRVTAVLKPSAVPSDALVAVVSPASTPKPDRVEARLEALRALGYAPQAADHILTRGPLYFAGNAGDAAARSAPCLCRR